MVGGLQLGNVWLGVQPALGLEGDPMRLLFERDLTPHPQYAAFYLWLQRGLAADAVCHLGAPAPAPPAMHQRRQPSLPPPCEAMCRELSLLQPWLCFFFACDAGSSACAALVRQKRLCAGYSACCIPGAEDAPECRRAQPSAALVRERRVPISTLP